MKAAVLLKRKQFCHEHLNNRIRVFANDIFPTKDFLIVSYLLQDKMKCASFSTSFELQY